MTRDTAPQAPTRKQRLPRWLKVLLVLVALLLLVAVTWLVLDTITRRRLNALLADIKARGWPTELADLYPAPIPDSENAEPLYLRAFAKAKAASGETRALSSLHGWVALSAEEQAQVRADLAESAEALELLHQAAQLPSCAFQLDYRKGWALELPHLVHLRNAVLLKRAAAIVALTDGRSEEAFSHWLDSVALVRHQEGQQLLISELVRLACLSVSLDALQDLAQSGQLAEPQLARAFAALENIEARDSFTNGLKGELALARDTFARLAEGDAELQRLVSSSVPGSGAGSGPRRRPWPLELFSDLVGGRRRRGSEPIDIRVWLYGSSIARPLRQSDEGTWLRLYVELIQLGEQRYYEVPQQLEGWERKVEDLSWYTKMGLGSLGRSGQALARGEAKVTAARTALALERYRLAHGDYPAALDALVPAMLPEVPLDPFDGKPLRYINDGKRVAVYSVGANLKEDGGAVDEDSSGPRDIVFTLRPGEARDGGEGQKP